MNLSGWHTKHSSVLDLGALPVSSSSACVLRLLHLERPVDAAPHAVDTPYSRKACATCVGPYASKFKILSVVVPPFDMNRRSITDLRNGEVSMENSDP